MTSNFLLTRPMLTIMIRGNNDVDTWYNALALMLPKYGITTPRRIAHFISQCAHESNNFRTLEENLNYSEEALMRVFPRYFGPKKEDPRLFARNPEKLANLVYMDTNRTKKGALGNVNPGDGWRFRGRGLKQLTGRNNYAAFGATIGLVAEDATNYVMTKEGAVQSACWFWDTNRINRIADTDDVVAVTRIINGGNIGLEDRQKRYNQAIQLLSSTTMPSIVLRVGSRGGHVASVQRLLNLNVDGVYGPTTESSVRTWQQQNGLTVDGVVGPMTWSRMFP